jgi:hypothetical protein
MAMTMTGTLTIVSDTLDEYNKILSDVQTAQYPDGSPIYFNINGDSGTLTVTFDVNQTV